MSEQKQYIWKLKSLTGAGQWKAFCEMLDFKIELQQKKLEQSKDPIDIYHAQGAIQILRQMKLLKEEINGTTE
jgi:hypothetical protein